MAGLTLKPAKSGATDGRCKKNSPYQTGELNEQDEILNRLKRMIVSELKQEILRLEIENKEL
ncbi:MAG: hypothetical protein LIO55_02240, partial [Oscillospiraceae bacterium]|nr:hypothetical protein [Oscillospiraceae bacterium]